MRDWEHQVCGRWIHSAHSLTVLSIAARGIGIVWDAARAVSQAISRGPMLTDVLTNMPADMLFSSPTSYTSVLLHDRLVIQ